MPHVIKTVEDRLNDLANCCTQEDFVLNFGYDPDAQTWFCDLENTETGQVVAEFVAENQSDVLDLVEEHFNI